MDVVYTVEQNELCKGYMHGLQLSVEQQGARMVQHLLLKMRLFVLLC